MQRKDEDATLSCSGDIEAGVPLKPVCVTVSARLSTLATPGTGQRVARGHRPSNGLDLWAESHGPWQCGPAGSIAASGGTEVGYAHFPAALFRAQQHIWRLDIAMDDLRIRL